MSRRTAILLLLLLLFVFLRPRSAAAVIFLRQKKTGHPNLDRWDDLIFETSVRHGIDPAFAKAVMWKESSGDPLAEKKESGGAVSFGLFQLLDTSSPRDAFEMIRPGATRDDLKDPVKNADMGIKYLANLLARYDGNYTYVAAAENAGSAAVFKDDKEDGEVVDAATGKSIYRHTYQSVRINAHPLFYPGRFINQAHVDAVMKYYELLRP